MVSTPDQKVDILLIEDNEGDVLLTKEGFRTAKVANNIHVCRDGETGVEFLKREKVRRFASKVMEGGFEDYPLTNDELEAADR